MRLALLLMATTLLVACGGGGGSTPTPPAPNPPAPPPPAGNQDPVASFTAPATLVAGGTAAFDASASRDPEGGALTYHWNFGDDTHGGVARLAHIYSDAGRFTARLRVTDPQGATHEATREIVVTDPPVARTVTASGLVTTTNGAALADVTVRALGSAATATSDAQGRLSLAVAAGRAVTLRFTKAGYADQVQVIELPAGAGADATFEVAMSPRAPAVTLADAAAGGSVTGTDGARLVLPANALVRADGTAVTGAIQVAMTPIDINGEELASFPGRFAGVIADGTRTPIVSYGTTEFVLTQSGQPLQLRAGARATIDLPLYAAANLDGTPLAAGGTLPLWSLDERSGVWIDEGTGTLVASTSAPAGLVMRAEVGHFSFWNADKGISPFRPRPRCINDVPGQYDSIFEQATICKILAEMDKPIPAQGLGKARANAVGATAQIVAPQFTFPSMRATAEAPITGNVTIDVPPDFDVVITGTALNGTWRGQATVRGLPEGSPDVPIRLRPITQGGPDVAISLPFDEIRAASVATTDRYRFTATAGQNVSIVVMQSASTLTGWVRLRNAAGEILMTAPFDDVSATIEFRLGAAGEYTIEVEPLANAPGAYRLAATTPTVADRIASITLTHSLDAGIAKVATNAAGTTWAAWPEVSGVDTRLLASRFIGASAGWSSPETVATITGHAAAVPVQLGVDDAGNVLALWDMGAGPVVARRAASSNAWSAPNPLAPAGCGGGTLQRLAVAPNGNAVVVWARSGTPGFCARRFDSSNATWSPEHAMDAPEAQPSLALDLAANGDIAAAWVQGGTSIPVSVRLARFRAGAWEAPVTMGGANAAAPGVVLTADGGLLVQWQNASRTVEATWQAPGAAAWTASQVLGTNSGVFYLPRAARRTASRLQVVWWEANVGLSSRELDTVAQTWSARASIVPARAASAANVAVGGGIVMWWASKLSGSGSDFGVSTWDDVAGAWTTPAAVLTPRPLILNQAATFADSGSIAVDGNGMATVLWRENVAPGQGGALLRAARIP